MNIKESVTAAGLLILSAQASALSGGGSLEPHGDDVHIYNPAPVANALDGKTMEVTRVAWGGPCFTGPTAMLPTCN